MKKILYVEDDETVVKTIKAVFQRVGFEVYSAKDAHDGLGLMFELRPHLIMTDIWLPGAMDGWEYIELIRSHEEFKYVPVVAITSQGDNVARVRSLEVGATAFVSKPFVFSDLIALIVELLDNDQEYQGRVHKSLSDMPLSDNNTYENVIKPLINRDLREKDDRFQSLLKKLKDKDVSLSGESIIELSKLHREDEQILRITPAQDAFWRNVYHSLSSLSTEEAVTKWGEMSELALALTKDQDEQNQMLRKIAVSEHVEMRIHALKALGLNQDELSLTVLTKSASDDNSKIRAAAVEALGMLANDESVPLLKSATHDSAIAVRYAAVNALAAVGTPQAVAILQETSYRDDHTVRIDVIKAVVRPESKLDSDTVLELMTKIIDGEQNNDVLYTVTVSLGSLGDAKAIPILEKLLLHGSEHVRQGAEKALKNLKSVKGALS